LKLSFTLVESKDGKALKASDYIVKFLHDRGVEIVFGYSGGAITHLMDSLNRIPGIRFLQTYHEQTAAIAAEGYTWLSGSLGVALATSGPGATNMITGISDAFFDSIPVIYITGQVNTYEYKGDKPIRQQGFQETDIVSIVKPITKYAVLINSPLQIRFELEKAWAIALSDRQGPVLIDIPMDIQRADVEESELPKFEDKPPHKNELRYLNGFSKEALVTYVRKAERPLLLIGSGVILAGAQGLITSFARKHELPVVTSLLAKGAFPENEHLSIGMIGSYGNRCANLAIANTDLLIAIGSRLDTRQTGTNLSSFVRGGHIVRLDIDIAELTNHRLQNVSSIHGDAKQFIEELSSLPWGTSHKSWLQYIERLKREYNQDIEVQKNILNKRPYQVMDILNRFSSQDQIFTVDIGQNQMFAAQKLEIKAHQAWRTSGGLAPMGFALPAAIGAAFASHGKRPIFAITGDGGLQMSSQSLLLIAQHNLPIKIILLNNKSLGMITQFQDLYFDRRKEGTTKESGYAVPNFALLAESFGLPYTRVDDNDYSNDKLLKRVFLKPGPALVEFDLGEETVVYPKLEVNRPIEDVNPKLTRDELRSIMLIDSID
jgi:acetolactate synthase-1/2/3 large subunit